MPLNEKEQAELDQFPDVLKQLLTDEQKAGNSIVELRHGYPAPPIGAYVMLAKPVITRPHKNENGLLYRSQNSSSCSGEYSDAQKTYFVLEPGDPNAGAYPDMDAIREAANRASTPIIDRDGTITYRSSAPKPPESLVERFAASMKIDYEKWHDGIGYDVDLIDKASPEEKKEIEMMIVAGGLGDWRDVEALARIDSPLSRKLLKDSIKSAKPEIRMAILRHAPELIPEKTRINSLLHAIQTGDIYHGLSQALDDIADFHPPQIVDALLRGCLEREGALACHFAGMLYFIHGQSKMPFDWDHRPFFLRFNTDSREERRKVFAELCKTIGVDAKKYL